MALYEMTLDKIKQRAARALCDSMIDFEEDETEIRLIIPRDSVLASRIRRDVIGYDYKPGPWGSQAAFIIKK